MTEEVNNIELVKMAPVSGGIYWVAREYSVLEVDVLEAGKMGKRKDLSDLMPMMPMMWLISTRALFSFTFLFHSKDKSG